MSTVNRKIIFTGPVGAGKTTAIRSISDIEIVTTDEQASDMAKARKPATTVAMDYGMIKLGDEERVHLYGTPGQRRFDFMCEILTKGALGLIILVDNSHDDPMSELDYYLNLNAAFLRSSAAVIGITHYDEKASPAVSDYYRVLEERGDPWPVMHVDARKADDVRLLLNTMLATLEYV